MKSFSIPAIVMLTLVQANPVSAAEPGDGKLVQPIGTGRSDHQVIYEVLAAGLEALGYRHGEMLTGSYPTIHLSVAQGDADYFAVNWRPLHDEFYDNTGGDDVLQRVGPLYTGAVQAYFIDKATADLHGITRLEQIKDPAIRTLFDTDGDGKANLTGCNPGWGCELVIEHQLDAFDLRDHVNHDKGEYFALLADTITRFELGEPIFYTAWTPSWMMSVLKPDEDVVFLDVPFSSIPDDPDGDTTMADGRNPGFANNDNYIIVNRAFAAENPAALAFLNAARIPIEDLNDAMRRINDGEDSAEAIKLIAEDWIGANRAEFDRWVAEARGQGG